MILHPSGCDSYFLTWYTNVDDSTTIAWMDQIQLLLPVVILKFSVSSASVEVADETARGNPKESGDGYDSHCEEKILEKSRKMRRNTRHSLTTLSRRKRRTLLILISSMISQNRSTTSWIVFSHIPLLQNPWMQGVPSGRMSGGSTAKHVSLIDIRQHLLQASAMTSHMQLWRPCVSQ